MYINEKRLLQQTLIIDWYVGSLNLVILLIYSPQKFLFESRIVITQETSHVSGGDLSSNPKREVYPVQV
jgi:hypothetical protein